jgi:hypothetical protein
MVRPVVFVPPPIVDDEYAVIPPLNCVSVDVAFPGRGNGYALPPPDPEIVIGEAPIAVNVEQETEPEHDTEVVATELRFPPDFTYANSPVFHGVDVPTVSAPFTAEIMSLTRCTVW